LDLETTRLENSISIAENSLSINERLNLLTKDQINQEKRRLQTLRIEQNLKTGLNDLDREKIALEQQYQDELKIAGGELPTTAEARFTQQFQQNELRRKALLETANAQRTILEEQAKLNDRTEYYSNSFNNMFQGMADAIVEFAKTGKFNFKDLINSFIADITRYELRLQATEAYVAARPFLVKLLGNLFAPNTATGGSSFNSYVNAGGFAKGGAFDTMGTIPGYAKGGMFTNSIVNSPTLFKAAKGLGVMGEAGPEAIMPLKRDSQGNLGVRGGGGNVEVVVNNYTQAKAETRETVDSRGNRRIEIVVADLVAGEISRPNSNVQQAFVNSFGTKPMVARR
jgi:lambda family phage tail tape measure protein